MLKTKRKKYDFEIKIEFEWDQGGWKGYYFWISRFPAFVNGKCTFALISTSWVLAFFHQFNGNVSDFFIQTLNMGINLFEMNFTVIINNSKDVKDKKKRKNWKKAENYWWSSTSVRQWNSIFLTWIHGKGNSYSILMQGLHGLHHRWIPWWPLKKWNRFIFVFIFWPPIRPSTKMNYSPSVTPVFSWQTFPTCLSASKNSGGGH